MEQYEETGSLFGFSRKKRSANSNDKESLMNKQDSQTDLKFTSKKGGWAGEGVKLKNSKSKSNLIDQERFNIIDNFDDFDDDIPVIPDIDDLQDDPIPDQNFKQQMPAVSPTVYQEIDFELTPNGSFPLSQAKLKTKNGDVSLTLLAKYLHSEKEIKDPDVIWTMESLWNEISRLDSTK